MATDTLRIAVWWAAHSGGRLTDTIGRRRIFLIASSLFLLTSLGAGLAGTFGWLLGFRAIQGVAAALLMPSALSIVTHAFTEPQARSKAIGIFSSFAALGSGSGLSAGGLLASWLGWQWVFFINVPVILLTVVLAYRYLPKDTARTEPLPDIPSGLLLTLVITALSYGVHELGDWARQSNVLLLLTLLVVGGTALFIRRNRAQDYPLLSFSVLKSSLTPIAVMGLLGATFTGYLFVISLILQQGRQLSAAQAGLLLFPFSLLSAVTGKYLLPMVLKRYSVRQTAIFGMASLVAGTLLLVYYSQSTDHPLFGLLMSLLGVNSVGIALSFSALTVLSLQPVPQAQHGLISGVNATAYFIGGGLGLSIVSLFLGQSGPGGQDTGIVPAVILSGYALLGLGWLLIKGRSESAKPGHTIHKVTVEPAPLP
ncbi:MFS transporter [Spirosoma sp. KNUC1025]|uniref:MFS transporter n=1 Tax=Spirosoma sp. KNUC1025 TaxID=2894082 RepID=UPI00386B5E19|nr:MFS transporter [Spirosoma sp. KNUC1025]